MVSVNTKYVRMHIFAKSYLFVNYRRVEVFYSISGLFTFFAWKLTDRQSEKTKTPGSEGLAGAGRRVAISKALFDERTCTSRCLKAGQLTSPPLPSRCWLFEMALISHSKKQNAPYQRLSWKTQTLGGAARAKHLWIGPDGNGWFSLCIRENS